MAAPFPVGIGFVIFVPCFSGGWLYRWMYFVAACRLGFEYIYRWYSPARTFHVRTIVCCLDLSCSYDSGLAGSHFDRDDWPISWQVLLRLYSYGEPVLISSRRIRLKGFMEVAELTRCGEL